MRILFLTTQLPYPPNSGGIIKSWNLVKHWAVSHELDLVCPMKHEDSSYLNEFLDKVKVHRHYGAPVSTPRTAMNLVKSYLGHASLNVYRNYSKDIQNKVDEWSHDADVIFIDHYEMGQYVRDGLKAKVVLHEHNAEFIMWERLADLEKNPVKKFVLKQEARRILKAEKSYAAKSDLILAAPNDIQELTQQGIDASKFELTYHLGEDFMLDYPDMEFEQTKLSLLFVGTLTWEANVDGLVWFFENCWQELRAKNPELTLTIVGKNADDRIVDASKRMEGIHLTGFVQDLEECYPHHRVFIIPLRFGSGIKVKLLNALYRGIPTVTTSIGTEGLDVTNGKHLYQAVGAEEYIDQVHDLLHNKEQWEKMRSNSRDLAKKYSWKSLLKQHDEQLEALLNQ